MIEPTCEQFQCWAQAGMPVKAVRMDGAGEKKKLQKQPQSKDWKLKIDYEITLRDTHQHNHLAELGFASLTNKGGALMHQSNIPLVMHYKVFCEAFNLATLLDGLLTTSIDGQVVTQYMHFHGSNPRFAKYLHTLGEAGMVKIKTKATPKIAD
jgi:hypothetical protein